MKRVLHKTLLNPFLIFAVLGLAILAGLELPDFSRMLEPVGGYYISLLKMIVLPYLFVTVTIGIAKIASDPNASSYVARLVLIYPAAMLFAALVAVGCCLLIAPGGTVDAASLSALGDIVNGRAGELLPDDEVRLAAPVVFQSPAIQTSFGERIIPENIFQALTNGDSLKVVVFCIVFGAALARNTGLSRQSLLDLFKVVQNACIEVIRWLNLVLPFALFAMVSSQVANVGIGPLVSLGRFIQVQALAAGVLMLAGGMIIASRARISPIAAFSRLGETITLAVTTRSSFACIPVAIRELTENLRFNRFATDLVMPLGTTICRIGAVPYYVIGVIFIAQVYGAQLDFNAYATIIVASIAAGIASSGATGTMTVLLIALVAEPLKLPFEAAIVLFIAVDPIIDIFRTVVLVYGNCALTSMIAPRAKSREAVEPQAAETPARAKPAPQEVEAC